MRKILRARSLRPVAWVLTMALLCSPLYLPVRAATAGQFTPSVAVVQVVNQSGSAVQNLANRAAAALSEKLAASGQYKVLGQAEVDQAVMDAGVRLPLRPDLRDQQLQAIADRLHADYLLSVVIDSVETDADKQLAVVKSRVDAFGRVAKGDVAAVETTAFNLARSSNEGLLLDDALEQNALYAVRDLTNYLNTVGKIIGPPNENTVRISFTDREPIRYGSEWVVLQDGVKYATIRLQSVHAGEAECLITKWHQPSYKFHTDDVVQLYRLGSGDAVAPHRDWDPLKEVHAPNEVRHKNTTTLWAIVGGAALLALGVWALTSGKDTRSEARTPSLVSPPNNTTLLVDAAGNFVNDVPFVSTSVRSADTVTLEIATDPAFANVVKTANSATTAAGGTTEGEPLTNVTFTIAAGTTGDVGVFSPGTFFWRVISVSGDNVYTSNVFSFNTSTLVTTRAAGAGAALRSPDSVVALPANSATELQWSPVPGAAGYEIWRRIMTPRIAEAASSRAARQQQDAEAWLQGDGRRSIRERRAQRANLDGANRSMSGASLAGFAKVAEVAALTSSYTDATVSNGTEYQWAVLTRDANGQVTPLNAAQESSFVISTPLSAAPPATPVKLAATVADGQVLLTWAGNTEADLAGYEVYRATSATGDLATPANLVMDAESLDELRLSAGPQDLNLVDRGVAQGVTVYYVIRAKQLSAKVNNHLRGGLESPLSKVVAVTP